MPQLRLTKSNIKKIEPPEAGQVLYWDTQLKGFGLRVGPRSRVFIAEDKVDGKTVRVTVGAGVPSLSAAESGEGDFSRAPVAS
jgi:hypothetical protein